MSDREIILIEVAKRGRDSVAAPVDYATMQADVATLKARPAITKLDDVPDVDTAGAVAGDVLTRASGGWVATAPVPPISVTDTGSVDLTLDGTTLSAAVKYAGSGVSDAAARWDHTHIAHNIQRTAFGPQAYMSSGTRTLASTSATLSAGVAYVVKATVKLQMRGADAGAAYYQLRVTINGDARTSPGGTAGFWCVQGVPDKTDWSHHISILGTGAAIPVTASVLYHSGAGFYTDAGEVEIELKPTR